ncbi:hypothetical protein CU254_00305 [Amycolatopsis sp. AA4]|uniref:hypothetical protein n=1 Tax=Actinomycetes TaxID=1760 RepID=UPI0001B554D7|nr:MULTISPECIES: hypothetical protein [Actinomycetes]ATY09099.1 hypothetical protein CU254_00305 [Amycolatopsis sp. AA4]EFL04385.1 predicted protein [Streptomyces sp. AA4]
MSTYNPVLSCVEVRRMRLGAPLRSPELGVAMVLERAAGAPIVVNHGERVPDARTGNYRRMHLIDVATRGLSFAIHVASKDPAFTFRVTVEFACQVTDPVAIALNKVTDMTASLLPSLTGIVREAAARFDVLEPAAAASAISSRLNSARDSPAVRLSAYSVSVSMVDNEDFVTEQRKIRVRKLSYDAMRPIAGGTREDMLAHIMSIDDGDPMALLDRERADRAAEMKAKIDVLRAFTGADMEDFSISEVREQVLGEFFDRSKAVPGKRRKLRDSLESRAKAEIEEAKVVEGNVPPAKDTAEDEVPSSKRASRLRGTLRPAEPENES